MKRARIFAFGFDFGLEFDCVRDFLRFGRSSWVVASPFQWARDGPWNGKTSPFVDARERTVS